MYVYVELPWRIGQLVEKGVGHLRAAFELLIWFVQRDDRRPRLASRAFVDVGHRRVGNFGIADRIAEALRCKELDRR